jgi:hypothetical protein
MVTTAGQKAGAKLGDDTFVWQVCIRFIHFGIPLLIFDLPNYNKQRAISK